MVAWEARVMSQHSVKIMTKAAQIRTGVPVSRSMKKGKNSTAPASEPMIMMTRPPNRSESHPARSEERRVGKEGRARRGAEEEEKKEGVGRAETRARHDAR